jgi:hypothetical protein
MTYKNLEEDEIENKFQLYKLIQKKKKQLKQYIPNLKE